MMDSVIVHYFLQLPVDIVRCILTTYLKGKSKYSLLQTTEKFNNLRKQIIYFKLNSIESKKFYLNRKYRQKVLSCLYQPQYQLHLTLDNLNLPGGGWPTALDLSIILPVHRLQILYFEDIDNFQLIGQYTPSLLDITGCNRSIDMNLCKGISTLSFRNCSNIENMDNFSDVNVCSLHSCELINFNNDFSVFKSLQVFALVGCDTITDVSPLAHIPELTLMLCPNITNVDVLTHNKKLTIQRCENIAHISLSDDTRHSVSIFSCIKLEEVIIAGKVDIVQLHVLGKLSNICFLEKVNHLSLEDVDSLIGLTNMNYVQSISLLLCDQLMEISPLLQVKSLEIAECQSITSIKSLSYLEILTINNAESLQLIEDLPLLKELEMEGCDQFKTLRNLPLCQKYRFDLSHGQLRRVEFINCPGYSKGSCNADDEDSS